MEKPVFEFPEIHIIRLSNEDVLINSFGIELPDTPL